VTRPGTFSRILLVSASLAVGVVGFGVVGFGGVAGAAGAATHLVVTSPATPVVIAPGKTATSVITVGNPGSQAIDAQVTAAGVKLLNNGSTDFVAGGHDPVFGSHVTIVPAHLHLPAGHRATVRLTINAPTNVAPNDYFLGFLVTPIVTGPSVAIVNQIGALVVVNVPGSRDERLAASYVGLPGLAWSSSVSGFVQVRSVGRSTVQFTTDSLLSGFPTPKPAVQLELPQALPAGLTRNEPIHVSSWLGVGWATIHTTLVYNLTNQRTGQVVLSKTVVLVNPIWLALPVAVVVTVALLVRRRRRKRARKARPGTTSRRTRPAHAKRSKELVRTG
jgi:hypothetical protein